MVFSFIDYIFFPLFCKARFIKFKKRLYFLCLKKNKPGKIFKQRGGIFGKNINILTIRVNKGLNAVKIAIKFEKGILGRLFKKAIKFGRKY